VKSLVVFLLSISLVSCTHQSTHVYQQYTEAPRTADPVYYSVAHLLVKHPEGVAGGTGFAIRNVNNNTYFVTVHHLCLRRGNEVKGATIPHEANEREVFSGKVVYTTRSNDMCIVRLYETGDRFSPVVFAPDAPMMGDRVYTIGAPGGAFPTKTEGFVVGYDLLGLDPDDGSDSKSRLITSVPAYHGNSGGPVYNTRHQVVGAISATHTEYPHSSISIHVEAIVKHLEIYFKKWQRVKKQTN
jgi:S1-C subfamily serine protease